MTASMTLGQAIQQGLDGESRIATRPAELQGSEEPRG